MASTRRLVALLPLALLLVLVRGVHRQAAGSEELLDAIAAGPNGTVWVPTDRGIVQLGPAGEVTGSGGCPPRGAFTHSPVPRVVGEPDRIAAGADGSIWFANDACLGRITAAGAITTWPVAGALRLERLAVAANGSIWLDQRFWRYFGAEPVVRDLDGDGRPELRSLDDRFSERFTHSLVRPLRIWSYRDGRLRDVTGRYPKLIRADAAKLWRVYLQDRSARAVLPAWMADQYRLGRQAFADRVLARAATRGELEHSYGYTPRSVRDFMAAVKRFLRQRVQ